MEEKKILLGIPTYKSICADAFAYQMAFLIETINTGIVKHLVMEANMYVTMARNMMCRTAVELWKEGRITHLLMVDDDVLIPPGGVAKLAAHTSRVVSGAYYKRDLTPVSYTLDPFKFHNTIPGSGTVAVDGTGAGCLLVSCELLNLMADRYKDEWWFQNTIVKSSANVETYLGEDVFFFRRLNQMGIRCAIDCDVQCGHIGVSVADRALHEIKNGIRPFIPTP